MPNVELRDRVVALSSGGFTRAEIAEECAISESYVKTLLNPNSWGTCRVCGGLTSSREFERCGPCRSAEASGREGVCVDCGGATSYKTFERCRPCAGKVGHPPLAIFASWSPELAYLLGWTITDGSISTSPRYSVGWMLKDREPLEIIRRLLGSERKIETIVRPTGRTYYRFRVGGRPVVGAFEKLGVTTNKAFTTRVPEMPGEVMPHFLRGVVDGDGCIVLARGHRDGYVRLLVDVASSSPKFLLDVQRTVGAGAICGALGSTQKLKISCGDAVRFLTWIYADSEGLRLARKYEKWQEFLASGRTYRE